MSGTSSRSRPSCKRAICAARILTAGRAVNSMGPQTTKVVDPSQPPQILARKFGSEPFNVVVVHGGPGAAGEMGPVAQRLGQSRGVLEPLQSATTVQGQVDELRMALESLCAPPVVLIGHSWGAWLTCFKAADHPQLVRKLILVGAPAFAEKYVAEYVAEFRENRLKRLTDDQRQEFLRLAEMLSHPRTKRRKISAV
jgi:pimeloyl-ACP methyl ester carboxylesterase